MNEKYYLKEGSFTKFTLTIENALKEIERFGINRSITGKISFYLTDMMKWNNPQNFGEFRQRNASEIIESGYYNSCSDRGIVFVALARKAGIPTKYIETIKKDNLKWKPHSVEGHVFTDIFLHGKWINYEPKNGFLKEGYWLGEDEYLKLGEGLDFSELHLNNGEVVNLNNIDKIRRLRNDIKF